MSCIADHDLPKSKRPKLSLCPCCNRLVSKSTIKRHKNLSKLKNRGQNQAEPYASSSQVVHRIQEDSYNSAEESDIDMLFDCVSLEYSTEGELNTVFSEEEEDVCYY